MPHLALERPPASEYAPFHAGYVAAVPDGDIFEILARQHTAFPEFLHSIGEARGSHRYAPDKWSVKEVVGHVNDAERVFSYRALRFARGDETPLASFEQEEYVPRANFNARTLASLADEFSHLRAGDARPLLSPRRGCPCAPRRRERRGRVGPRDGLRDRWPRGASRAGAEGEVPAERR